MAALLGLGKSVPFRESTSVLPEKPPAVPYEMRTEMTWVDFSHPSNPLGAPKSIVQHMHAALVDGELNYVPDRDGREFRHIISKYLGVDYGSILVGTTPTQLMMYAAMAFDYGTVGISIPCMPEYLTAIANAGHSILELSNKISFAPVDAYTAQEEFGEFEGVVLANPSYPSSRLLPRQTLIHYLETCTWVIVDESNIELSFGAESVVPLTEKYPNLMVLRNPSNTYGMPGVPISYLVAHPETIKRIGQFYDGTDVGMFAEVLARQFASQVTYLDETHDFLDTEIPWMQCNLSLIPGMRIFPAEGNFVLCEFKPGENIKLGVDNAEDLLLRLQLAGYFVPSMANIPGLDGRDCFCVAIRTREENAQLLDALRRIISQIEKPEASR